MFPLSRCCHGLAPFAFRLAPVTADSDRSTVFFPVTRLHPTKESKGTSQEVDPHEISTRGPVYMGTPLLYHTGTCTDVFTWWPFFVQGINLLEAVAIRLKGLLLVLSIFSFVSVQSICSDSKQGLSSKTFCCELHFCGLLWKACTNGGWSSPFWQSLKIIVTSNE